MFRKDGKRIEEKVGRQYADSMTSAIANKIKGQRMGGKRPSLKELREKSKKEDETEKNSWTIDKLWGEYKSVLTNGKSVIIDESRYRNYIQPYFGNKEPVDLELVEIDKWKIKIQKEPITGKKKNLSLQTVKHILTLLTRIVNFGVKRSLCEKLPFHIEKPKVNNIKMDDLSTTQLIKLLKAIEQDENIQVKNLMKIALYTGMRRGEIFKLKWVDIDFNRGFIYIRDSKGGSDQKIPLNNDAREVFVNHPRQYENSPFVFPGNDGKQRVTAQQAMRRIRNRAGLPKDFRPLHGLRHTYASMLASSGKVDLYTLQKLLTHKSPVMTQRYAHLRDESLRKASDLAGDIINDIIGKKKEEEK